MLTLVVRAGAQPLPLIETLTPLVAGVVKGLVGRSYIVCNAGEGHTPPADIARVAEDAGGDLIIAASWAAGVKDAAQRSKNASHCIVIDAGVLIDPSFWPAAERFLRLASSREGVIGATSAKRGLVVAAWRSVDRITGRTNADQVMLVSPGAIVGDVWNRRYGHNLVPIDSTSHRLKL